MNQQNNSFAPLLRIFEQRKETGEFYYSKEDVRNALPFLVFYLTSTEDIESVLSPKMKDFLDEFLEDIGASDPNEMLSVLQEHYTKNPINPELLKELGTAARQMLADNQGHMLNPLAKELLGESKPQLQLDEEQKKSRNFLSNMLLQRPGRYSR